MKINVNPQKIEELLTRGVEEIIEKESLIKKLKSGKQLRIKFGIDPTAPDIHLGHSVPLRKLKQFQELGHKIILIIGDFTAMIGDPSGRSETRKPLTKKKVTNNLKKYLFQVGKIIDIKKTEINYNSKWFGKNVEPILEISRASSIQQILHRADFQKRISEGVNITLLEILYPLLQGYDSVKTKADVEIGGTDQKFNLLMGRQIQKHLESEKQDIMTLPLLEGTDGVRKMSKSYNNYIGIAENPNNMFGKIMSVKDELIVKYFLLCTDVPENEIKDMGGNMQSGKLNPRDAKAKLAYKIVALYHGKIAAQKAKEEFNRIFKEKGTPSKIPLIKIIAGNIDILDLLVKTKLASSKAEAKRLIEQKGVKIDNEIQGDWRKIVPIKKEMIIQAGKRKFVKITQ